MNGPAPQAPPAAQPTDTPPWLDLKAHRLGQTVARFETQAEPTDGAVLRRLLVDAVKRDGQTCVRDRRIRDGCPELLVLTAYIRPVAWIDDAVMAAARQHRLATLSPGRTLNGDLAFPIVDEHLDW